MIARFIVHIEAHRGRWPVIRVRRAPRPGERFLNGIAGWGVLVRCDACSGDGLLHHPDPQPHQPLVELDETPTARRPS